MKDDRQEKFLSADSFQDQAGNWAYVYGKPQYTAQFRSRPEDFAVTETLPFDFTGEGEHVYLQVQKKSLNTMDVVQAIAKIVGLPPSQIGYAGLKDKHAVATQWFSVQLPGVADLCWEKLENDKIKLLSVARHQRKLKTGAVKSNAFMILLRSVSGGREDIDQRLQTIQSKGVANYFGEQRFGRGFSNMVKAQMQLQAKRKVRDRQLRGIYYSSLRSWIFNEVLSARINDQLWDKALQGDVIMLNGTHSFFIAEILDDALQHRLQTFDVHLSGPMMGEEIGKGGLQSLHAAKDYELALVSNYSSWCDWLAREGLKSARRALRVVPTELKWSWTADNDLELTFQLPAGCYATSVLREVVLVESGFD